MESVLHSVEQDIFLKSSNHHLALTQYYRWFQIYERPFSEMRIHHQLGILSESIVVESIANTLKGKSEYKDRLKVYEGSQNAHHVQHATVLQLDENTLQLKAKILYQGIQKNAQAMNAYLHYDAFLSLQANELPCFTNIKITMLEQCNPPSFKDSYAFNRAASLMHRWLYQIESQERGADDFKELLADHFELVLSGSHTINTWEQFKAWIDNIDKRIKHSAHAEKNFSVSENEDGTINMNVEFDWQGVSIDGKPMTAATRHTWVIENDLNERFAKIKRMVVDQVRPFEVVE
jgi:hypothetical protein